MKNWTGKFCLLMGFSALSMALGSGCSSTDHTRSTPPDDSEVSVKEDQAKIDEMRKDIPAETRKSNDRLGEMLKTWKDQQMPPDRLREKFEDEIRKMRLAIEKKHKRLREDFTRSQQDRRRDFQDKQKQAREDFFSSKPTSEKRSQFIERQGEDRDRFNSDLRDERDEFEEQIRDERKDFESDIADRWSEFRSEYPEYRKVYDEKQAEIEKKKEAARNGGHPPSGTRPSTPPNDVNQGGDGWPASNPDELNEVGH